ncbi:MAG: TatD family hydrolase [bacterium]|nr:TatD family hydrolase [bacterium]
MITWYDTHCHLTENAYQKDRYEVIQRMKAIHGVAITLGVDVATSEHSKSLALLHSHIYFCAGIHPHEADRCNAKNYQPQLETLWQHPKCVAVGEIGLDNFRDYSKIENQAWNFLFQLECAKAFHKPIVIHNRNASDQILKCLDQVRYSGTGVWHCFSGDKALVEEVVARGFYVSFAGNVTYESSPLLEVALSVPLDRLLIETDAPWLAPNPLRKTRNEPSYVAYTGSFLAQQFGIEETEFQKQLAKNSQQLFQF